MKRIACRYALLVLFTLSIGCARLTAPTPHTITVTGTFAMRVVPDHIVWNLSVLDTNKDLRPAKEASDGQAEALVALIRELGVPDGNVQTGGASIPREYTKDKEGRNKDFSHFAVRRSFVVRQDDLNRFDEFFERITKAANVESNFSFATSQQEKLRWDARLEAMRTARRKAEEVAQAAGARLGRPLTISETDPNRSGFGGGTFANNGVWASPGNADADQIKGTLAPGTIDIRQTIYVTYELK